jgi:molybdopterin-guanine dinucleotide biosynthesis protein A
VTTSNAALAAGIVLAGGRSSRMGESKAALEWHGSTLLRRTAGLLARSVGGPVLVVRAPGQELPALPAGVETVDDPVEGRGPMQGIATGLAAVADRAQVAFVCSTDLPFLHPAYVRRVLDTLDADTDAVLPHARGHRQPLAAAYRTALAPVVAELVADGRLKLAMLFDHCRVQRTDDAGLLADVRLAVLDPELDSVLNVNEPDDYRTARGRPGPEITVQRYGALASNGHRGPGTVRAATLGAAASAVGLALDRHVVAALNGDQITRDAETPLVPGDTVAFLSADAGG